MWRQEHAVWGYRREHRMNYTWKPSSFTTTPTTFVRIDRFSPSSFTTASYLSPGTQRHRGSLHSHSFHCQLVQTANLLFWGLRSIRHDEGHLLQNTRLSSYSACSATNV